MVKYTPKGQNHGKNVCVRSENLLTSEVEKISLSKGQGGDIVFESIHMTSTGM